VNTGPIFIVGAPRSGTTLLQFMLRCHPRIFLPTGESHFLIPLYRNAKTFGDLSRIENIRAVLRAMYKQSAEFLDTDLPTRFDIEGLATELQTQGCDTMPRLVAGLFAKNARAEGKVRWGDKTPYYVLHMDKLLEWFPDAQFIHLIRDGRDVALSLFARRDDFGVYNTYFAAKYWEQFVKGGRELGPTLPEGAYLEIRYEDILQDQEGSVRKICAFLGEEYSEAVVNFKTTREPGKTPLLQKRVQSDNAGKWRSKLTSAQIKIFESVSWATLAACGYPTLTSADRLPLPLRAAMRWHNEAVAWYRRKLRE